MITHREAAASFEAALAALEHLPDDRERARMAIDLHLHMREALNPLGELQAIPEQLQCAEALARGLGDKRRLADVLCNAAKYFVQVFATPGEGPGNRQQTAGSALALPLPLLRRAVLAMSTVLVVVVLTTMLAAPAYGTLIVVRWARRTRRRPWLWLLGAYIAANILWALLRPLLAQP